MVESGVIPNFKRKDRNVWKGMVKTIRGSSRKTNVEAEMSVNHPNPRKSVPEGAIEWKDSIGQPTSGQAVK